MPSPNYHYEGWTCSVYAISDGCGNVKFGVAKNVEGRIKTMQTGNAHPLQLLFECVCESELSERKACSSAYCIEHNVHELLGLKRMTGEWFAVNYHEAYASLKSIADWFRQWSKHDHVRQWYGGVTTHPVHVHTNEENHIWYWPTSDVYERGLVQ